MVSSLLKPSCSIFFIMETGKSTPQGTASLEGAEFTWSYDDGYYNSCLLYTSTASPVANDKMEVEIRDLGFGEFFPATGRAWKSIIMMG